MTYRIAVALVMVGLAAAPAHAQRGPIADTYQEAVPPPEVAETTNNKAIDRRLDRTEKALRELRSIVLKAQAQGAPVEVKPAGPDPIVNDLQARFGDVESTLRNLTGQTEALRNDLEQLRRSAAATQAKLDQLTAAMSTAPVEGATEITPPPPVSGGVTAPAASEADVYADARRILDSGDFAGGAAAMQGFIDRFPNSPRVGTANYWQGRAFAARNRHTDAAAAFARSLKGWPQQTWAGDSTVQLAGSLVAMNRRPDACKALTEFDTRYAAKASTSTKALAARTRTNADCG